MLVARSLAALALRVVVVSLLPSCERKLPDSLALSSTPADGTSTATSPAVDRAEGGGGSAGTASDSTRDTTEKAMSIEVTEDDAREIGRAIRAHLEASPGPNSEILLKKNMEVVSRGPDGYRVGIWALVPKEDYVLAEYWTMLSAATMWIAQARVERENGSWVAKQVDHRRALLKPPYPGAPTR